MEDRSIDVYVSIFITLTFATLALLLRLAARRVTKVNYGYDDLLAVVAFICAVVWSTLVLIWVLHWRLGRTLKDTSDEDTVDEILTKSRLILYFAELSYAFSLAFSKFAILAFYWRMFSTSNIRIPIQILVGTSVIWLVLRTFLAIFHCVPVQAFWDKTIEGATCAINDSEFFFGTVLAHFFIDIAILILPVMQVRRLHLRAGQKLAVIALFMFGILVCIASIFVLVESLKFDPRTNEMPFDIAWIMVWATVEVNLAIVSACLPMLRPIFRRLLPGSLLSSEGHSSQPLSRPTGAIKLTTLTRTKEADDESSSTHHLHDLENGSPQFDSHTSDGLHGPQTTITGPLHSYPSSRNGDEGGGILVRSEMTVHVERA
ncbi:Fc.00g044450.m01.CDS01 [Cosmosporella sp. VM-42]